MSMTATVFGVFAAVIGFGYVVVFALLGVGLWMHNLWPAFVAAGCTGSFIVTAIVIDKMTEHR